MYIVTQRVLAQYNFNTFLYVNDKFLKDKNAKKTNKTPFKEKELFKLIESGLPDIEILGDNELEEDDGWESDAYKSKLLQLKNLFFCLAKLI